MLAIVFMHTVELDCMTFYRCITCTSIVIHVSYNVLCTQSKRTFIWSPPRWATTQFSSYNHFDCKYRYTLHQQYCELMFMCTQSKSRHSCYELWYSVGDARIWERGFMISIHACTLHEQAHFMRIIIIPIRIASKWEVVCNCAMQATLLLHGVFAMDLHKHVVKVWLLYIHQSLVGCI